MAKLRTRDSAAKFLMETKGAPVTASTLKDMASKGTGPKFAIINGRACYTEENLSAWLEEQLAKPVAKRNYTRHAVRPVGASERP